MIYKSIISEAALLLRQGAAVAFWSYILRPSAVIRSNQPVIPSNLPVIPSLSRDLTAPPLAIVHKYSDDYLACMTIVMQKLWWYNKTVSKNPF